MEQAIVMLNVHMTSNSSVARQTYSIGHPLKLILIQVVENMALAVQKWTFGRPIPDLKPSPLTLARQLEHLDVMELIVEITSLITGKVTRGYISLITGAKIDSILPLKILRNPVSQIVSSQNFLTKVFNIFLGEFSIK